MYFNVTSYTTGNEEFSKSIAILVELVFFFFLHGSTIISVGSCSIGSISPYRGTINRRNCFEIESFRTMEAIVFTVSIPSDIYFWLYRLNQELFPDGMTFLFIEYRRNVSRWMMLLIIFDGTLIIYFSRIYLFVRSFVLLSFIIFLFLIIQVSYNVILFFSFFFYPKLINKSLNFLYRVIDFKEYFLFLEYACILSCEWYKRYLYVI